MTAEIHEFALKAIRSWGFWAVLATAMVEFVFPYFVVFIGFAAMLIIMEALANLADRITEWTTGRRSVGSR